MAPRRLLLVALAIVFAACTKNNANYCAHNINHSCAADASAERPATSEAGADADAGEVGDASGDGDAGDGATDGQVEQAPICSADDACVALDAGVPACDTSDGGARCVECTKDAHCKDSNKPVCDTTKNRCVQCTGTDPTVECQATGLSVCDTSTQTCVQCLDDKKCANPTPVCDTTSKSCRICKVDSECKDIGPGVCVDWDGHCATSSEVVTLKSNPGCALSGVADFKFCKSADAAVALSVIPPRPVLLVQGPDPVAAIDLTSVGQIAPKVLIVGQGAAVVGAGSGDVAGVHLGSAAKFWVRDLAISGGTLGVAAEMTPELHLTRCVITHNDKGGLRTTGTGFDITNTIVAANGAGSDLGGVAFGGVRLGTAPASGPSNFANNTVVDNLQVGISCATPYDVSTSIVHGNNGGDALNCTGGPCCGPTNPDPLLDPSYRLKMGSPCIDKITPSMSTVTVDIDGHARPFGAKLDCGADEFVQ
jgi:hypothetical protein